MREEPNRSLCVSWQFASQCVWMLCVWVEEKGKRERERAWTWITETFDLNDDS